MVIDSLICGCKNVTPFLEDLIYFIHRSSKSCSLFGAPFIEQSV